MVINHDGSSDHVSDKKWAIGNLFSDSIQVILEVARNSIIALFKFVVELAEKAPAEVESMPMDHEGFVQFVILYLTSSEFGNGLGYLL